ncbi:hypothetical protein CHS0354_023844 [Potamilus streckersoni]|uniref:ABC transporter domain-containing protein n=1 Tax=Potamilus streckersoni TaxID=2493646 RepID=A0AAE0RZG2_9BIVA|nr:hypothetical protein CHS0354_023844 [Potamilus streckersoni]
MTGLFVTLSGLISMSTEYLTLNVGAKINADLQLNMFAYYVNQNYNFHINGNSSILIAHITFYVKIIVNIIQKIITLISSYLLAASLIFVLFYKDTSSTLILTTATIGTYWFLTLFTKKRLIRYGKETAERDINVIRILNQTFEGIKEIKDTTEIFDTLVLIGVAGSRLVPTLHEMYLSIVTLLNSREVYIQSKQQLIAAINFVEKRKKEMGSSTKPIPIMNQIELKHINFSYKEGNQQTLKDLNMKIAIGKSYAIVGPSGSGKTTTVDILLGLLTPQTGELIIDGDHWKYNEIEKSISHNFAYVPQTIFLLDDTISHNIVFDGSPINTDRLHDAIEKAQLRPIIETLPLGIDTIIGERGIRLSGGQRQRIGIARALYQNTPIIVFDEATSSLDVTSENEIVKSIESLKGQKTLIVIAHRLSTVKKCDLIFFLNNGNIVNQGTFDELIQKDENFKKMNLLS